jgi:hypothetical protein
MDFFSPDPIAARKRKREKAINKKINPEQWFLEQLEAFTQKRATNEKTADCCSESFLQSYAAKAGSVSLSDPRVEHVSSCNYCMPRLLRLRESRKAARAFHERIARVAALAVACLVGGFLAATYWDRAHLIAPRDSGSLSARSSVNPIERTLDLTNYATTRGLGDEPAKPPLILPAAMLHVHIILPPFSEGGNYRVLIAHDREGKTALVCANGVATTKGYTAKLDVSLDLRGVKPGNFLLLTELEGQYDFYSYPLNVE